MKRLLAAVVMVLVWASPALANHSWNTYRWGATEYPLQLRVVDSTSKGLRRQHVLPKVLREWGVSERVDLARNWGKNTPEIRRRCSIPAGRIRICDANFGSGEFGHTDLALDGDRIVGARILVNNYWGTGRSYRQFVICHELGHALGLSHQTGSSDSCLAGGQHPDAHDYKMLLEIYHPEPPSPPDDECTALLCQPLTSVGATIVDSFICRQPGIRKGAPEPSGAPF